MSSKPRMPFISVSVTASRISIFSDTFTEAEDLLKMLEKYGITAKLELRSPWCG